MKNKFKYILLFLVLVLYFFGINYFSVINDDLIWNYGFCSNFANGMKMYKDYNMVITPLYPFFVGTGMKLFGNNMIVFYLINSLIPTFIMLLILKMNKKAFILTMLLLSFVSVPNYNLLCILFLFILMYLEEHNKNDYLIGVILGLTFLTKSSVGVFLSLPTIYYLFKDYKKVLKRIIGFLLPNIFVILIFYLNGSLYDYINYCFLGLFSFASGNTEFSLWIIILILSISYLIREYIKNKNLIIIYILCFQLIAYPIFNGFHVMYASVPVIYYIMSHLSPKIELIYKEYSKLLLLTLICPIAGTVMIYITHDFTYDNNIFKYRYVNKEFYENSRIIDSIFKGNYDNVYFVMYSSYLNKYLLNIPINKYDLLLKGNLGYNGEERIINDFKDMQDIYFVTYDKFEGGQASKKIYDYVVNNTKYVTSKGRYNVYYQN